MKEIILIAIAMSSASTFAGELNKKCVYIGQGTIGRVAKFYDITVNDSGTLLTFEGKTAKLESEDTARHEKKYRAGGKTFWFTESSQTLRRFDANQRIEQGDSRGNFYYRCR